MEQAHLPAAPSPRAPHGLRASAPTRATAPRAWPLALFLVLALGACRSATPTPEAAAGSAAAGAPGAAGGAGSAASGAGDEAAARAAIEASMKALQAKGSYRVTMTAGGVSTQAEVQLPDRLRIVAQGMGQVLVIGPHTYSETQGQWSRISTASSLGDILRQMVPDLEVLIQNARAQGSETLDGMDCRVYTFDSEQDLGMGKVTATVTLWIDPATGLPRRQTVSGQDPALPISLTSDFSYPADIVIEAPATFTDLGAGPGAPGGSGNSGAGGATPGSEGAGGAAAP